MKKIYLFLTLVFSILIPNFVSADSTSFPVYYYLGGISSELSYSSMKLYFESSSDIITDMFQRQLSAYSSYSSSYPYYHSSILINDYWIQLDFYASNSLPLIDITSDFSFTPDITSSCFYSYSDNSFSGCDSFSVSSSPISFYSINQNMGDILANNYFFSNYDLRFSNTSTDFIAYYTSGNSSIEREFLRESNTPIPTLYDFLELSFLSEYDNEDYTEVNLNNYAYIVLSLKDYSNLISPVNFQVKGQLCLTPVYNYGKQEKNVTDRCSVVYDNFTPVRFYINQKDLDNHAVFYLIAYNTSIDNIVKINNRVFDISYITSDNADEPTAVINGRVYPVLPYSSLTSSATINESNDFIPGESENIFDITSDSSFISDLFSHPLDTLHSVWNSIVAFFSIIGSFISLLPSTLQSFLLCAFALGLILGLIKIIL